MNSSTGTSPHERTITIGLDLDDLFSCIGYPFTVNCPPNRRDILMPETKPAPPYVSYGAFTKAIEILADTIVPTGPLDRRVLKELSGADYGALISGLRFLGLVDDERRATATYQELVEVSKEAAKFKPIFLRILTDKYKPIVGHVNLQQGTAPQLEKAFRDYGVAQGQMLTKSIRFFLKAFTEAGVTPSPHMTAPKPRAPRSTKKGNKKNGDNAGADKNGEGHEWSEQEAPPHGYERLPLPGVPNSFIQYPANLTEAHCQILEAMVGVLKTSVKARTGGKGTQ
jgi:hypothetical protein